MSRAVKQNHFLAALPDTDLKPWLAHLQPVKLNQGDVLHEPGRRASHVYFPTSAIVSIVYAAPGQLAAEIGMVGREGVIGASLLVDEDGAPPGWAVVQTSGWGFRLDAQRMRAEQSRSSLTQLMLRHTLAVTTQMAQTAACVRQHCLIQQICRWVLLCLDRVEGTELPATQAVMASKLGVRRASISECLHKLEKEELIRHVRGLIAVLDRTGLERRACDCYEVIRSEYRRLRLAP